MRLFLTISAVLLGALPARAQFVIYDANPRIIEVPQSAPLQTARSWPPWGHAGIEDRAVTARGAKEKDSATEPFRVRQLSL